MNNLVIDIGNTFTKVAFFDKRQIVEQQLYSKMDTEIMASIIDNRPVDNAIISSVSQDVAALEAYLASFCNYIRFSSLTPSPVKNHYGSVSTLGLDRYAAVIGAASLFPGKDCLVIDAGTCITYDLIDQHKNYFGGSISPGIAMRYRAMNAFTGKLPLVETNELFDGHFGNDTRSAMVSGVQNGVMYEIKGFIDTYRTRHQDLSVVICGGDVNFLDSHLKNSIFAPIVKAVPDLVLIGLNEVIHHNNDSY